MSVEKRLTIRTDAASVLAEIRRALSVLVSHVPGNVRRPKDLQRTLGVDYKLCWQVLNITRTDDPLSISQYVPGSTSIKKLLAAAGGLGVPDEALRDVDQAMKEFADVVATHSRDRRGFDSMVATISGGDAAESLALQHRRDAFRSESQIWGTQVEMYLRQMIVRKADNGIGIDKCFVNAKYGLRCLRQDVQPIIHGYRETSVGLSPTETIQPLDPVAAKEFGAPVLADFTSQPVPSFKTIQHTDGWSYSALDTDQIGRKSTVNMVFGGVARNTPMERNEEGLPALLCGAAIIAPTELEVVELFVHRPSFGELKPQFQVYATGAGAEIPDIMRLTQNFLIFEEVQFLGSAKGISAVADAPSYLLQLNHVFQKLGWDPAEFDSFRLRIPYPILHTTARIICQVYEQ